MANDIKQAVILAGGRGERLKPMTDHLPKPMVEFHEKPFLEYLIRQLKCQGIEEIVLLVGYLGKIIENYFGNGKSLGVNIRYSYSPVESQTGQRLTNAKHLLDSEFMLLYCDNYCPINLKELADQWISHKSETIITIYNNTDMFTKNNVMVNQQGYVEIYDPTRKHPDLNGVEIGYCITNHRTIDRLPQTNIRFEHYIYPLLASEGSLRAHHTNHRYYSIGSKDRLKSTESFLKPQKAVILDRDGVLNKKPPQAEYVRSWEEFEWIPGSLEALKLLKQSGYKIIVVTNQPGIARGIMEESDLSKIHNKMVEDATKFGATIDQIYYCPHGWNEGCFCRKPRPGMLFNAQKDHHLDLSKTLFIGDDDRDKQASISGGCQFRFVNDKVKLIDIARSYVSSAGETIK